jgi:chitodextrinase
MWGAAPYRRRSIALLAFALVAIATPGLGGASAATDTTAPSNPTSLTLVKTTTSSITIVWTASTDNVGVTGYGIYLNQPGSYKSGPPLLTATTTTTTIPNLNCGTVYKISVDAVDAAGNHSSKTTIPGGTSPCPGSSKSADTTPPSAPGNLVSSGSTSTGITIGWTASGDNVGVAGYDAYVNGVAAGQTTGLTYAFGSLSCGTSYTLSVDAYDAAGNHSAKTTITASTGACAVADTVAPSVPSNQAETASTQTTITMSWTPSTDNVGVAGYNVFLNGSKVGSTTLTTYTYGGLSCGTSYTVGLQAFDAAGNVSSLAYATGPMSTSACSTPTPNPGDTLPPSTPTGLAVSAATTTGISLTWAASIDNVGVVGYDLYLNGSSVGQATTTSYAFIGLTCGVSYTLGVAAYDAANNVSNRATVTASTSACPTPTPTPTGALYISSSGSDSNACSQTAPCKTFQRAYTVAQPGQTVVVAGGTYSDASVSGTKSSPKVLFQPAVGASVSINNSVISASNLEFDNLSISYLETDYPSDAFTCRNCSLGNFGIYGSSNTSIIGGQSGPSYNPTGSSSPPVYITYGNNGTVAPLNVLIDGLYIHDYRRANSLDHMECIMVMGATARSATASFSAATSSTSSSPLGQVPARRTTGRSRTTSSTQPPRMAGRVARAWRCSSRRTCRTTVALVR